MSDGGDGPANPNRRRRRRRRVNVDIDDFLPQRGIERWLLEAANPRLYEFLQEFLEQRLFPHGRPEFAAEPDFDDFDENANIQNNNARNNAAGVQNVVVAGNENDSDNEVFEDAVEVLQDIPEERWELVHLHRLGGRLRYLFLMLRNNLFGMVERIIFGDLPEIEPEPNVEHINPDDARIQMNVQNNAIIGQNDDNNVAVVGIENDSDHDVLQDIPDEEPLPSVSRKRSREDDDEEVQGKKRVRFQDEFAHSGFEFVSARDTDRTGSHHVDNPANEDINQQVTQKEILPGGSTKRSREEDVEDEEQNGTKKIRLANPDPQAGPSVSYHTESSDDELFEDALEELDNSEPGGSRKRSREDLEETKYMIILFMVFIVQFSVSSACLAINREQQDHLLEVGWNNSESTQRDVEKSLNCCGFKHVDPNGTCDAACFTNNFCSPCADQIQEHAGDVLRFVGGIGLFFSFTEILGVWLTYRYRNQKDPRANPSAFL